MHGTSISGLMIRQRACFHPVVVLLLVIFLWPLYLQSCNNFFENTGHHEWAISFQAFLRTKWNPHYPNSQSPVDGLLDMRALGGAITSSCSNDTGYRRPPPAIFRLKTFYFAVVGFLLFNLNIVSKGTLWKTARISLCLQMACTVVN